MSLIWLYVALFVAHEFGRDCRSQYHHAKPHINFANAYLDEERHAEAVTVKRKQVSIQFVIRSSFLKLLAGDARLARCQGQRILVSMEMSLGETI